MGGLLAASVLANHFQTVTIVDRDDLPDQPTNRRGVPQGRHVHALLGGGAQALNSFLPGILQELRSGGAVVLDDGDLSRCYSAFGGHVMPRVGQGKNFDPARDSSYQASRPFLEFHVRRRLAMMPNVTIKGGLDVAELIATEDRRRVTGVRVAERGSGIERDMAADVIMDATGRAARTPVFLESLGYERPPEDRIVVRTTYASQALRIPAATIRELITVISPVPDRPRGMFLAAYEHDMWIFTVFGMTGQEPPGELAGMLAFAQDYAPAHVGTAISAGEPVGEVVRHRIPHSQWRRYDKLRRFPEGLLVCGDAICSLNPIYGQGMSVAAMDAVALRDCLRRGSADLARRYFRATAKSIGTAWSLGSGSDLRFPEVQGRRTPLTRLTNWYGDWMIAACAKDTTVLTQFFRVSNLIDPPTRLVSPSFVFRTARANATRSGHAQLQISEVKRDN
ncbi:NAD(P)/FAD-dependent oxidoreductase [Mycobacterium sp. NPDC051804]|uniref:NAD(P)/FAD-dependent oxidoreductase n=1 Tax=Mycobacterium sp. NPDC051804 TaxID=3364295 RepID=UPI0037B86244